MNVLYLVATAAAWAAFFARVSLVRQQRRVIASQSDLIAALKDGRVASDDLIDSLRASKEAWKDYAQKLEEADCGDLDMGRGLAAAIRLEDRKS